MIERRKYQDMPGRICRCRREILAYRQYSCDYNKTQRIRENTEKREISWNNPYIKDTECRFCKCNNKRTGSLDVTIKKQQNEGKITEKLEKSRTKFNNKQRKFCTCNNKRTGNL